MNKKRTAENPKGVKRGIIERNRLALAYLELTGDKVFQSLPEEEKNNLLKEVIAIGDETASWVKKEYGTNDPRKIATKMGLKVYGEQKSSLKRSEYRRERKEIAISRRFHERLLEQVESKELTDRLLKLVVAHELFHHLEAERIGDVYKRYSFKLWQLGPVKREKQIKGLSEVAAQAFTQMLLGLEVTAEVFDCLVSSLYSDRVTRG